MSSVKNFAGKFFGRSGFRALFLALSPLLFAPATSSAAIPQTINYQGFLLSKITNLPVETPQDIKFVIYDAASGGSVKFSESRCNVPVSKGRYEVEVGATSGGIPDTVFVTSPNLWLEIQVDPDGDCAGTYEAMSPRIHLQASPYAFNSLYASTASAATPLFTANVIGASAQTDNGAITISTNLFVMGGISVGNISPGQMLSVAGMVESKGDPATCVASQTCGYKFPDGSIQTVAAADTMWKISGPNMYSINPGNVGIGESVANPLARLHISTAAGETGDVVLVTVGGANVFRVNGLGQVYGNGTTLSGIVAKAGDTMTGQLTLAGSSLTVTSLNGISAPKITFQSAFPSVAISSEASAALGGGLRVSSNVYVVGFSSAAKYYGDGSSLTAVTTTDLSKVRLSGDTMTGQLTLLNSTLTVTGAAFSVTGSTFSVFGGSVAVGGLTYPARLSVIGGILATSSITAQGGLYTTTLNGSSAASFQTVTASSATFSNWGPDNYSIYTASGIMVNTGIVNAPYFVGDGSQLLNVAGTDSNRVLKAGDTMTGNLLVSGSSITVLGPVGGGYSLTVVTAAVVNAYSLAIDGSGNVGVQVSTPSAPLEVFKQIMVSNSQGPGGDTSLSLLASGGGQTYLNWAENSLIASGGAAQGALGFPIASRDLVYRAGGSNPGSGGQEVFRISAGAAGANWKLGIGTNAPQEKFHVATNILVSTSGFTSPILYISTTAGTVSISTAAQNYALTVNGGIMAVSSITAQGGFFGDGAGITNIAAGGLPAMLVVSSISASAANLNNAVVFTSDTYVNAKLAVGPVIFTPASPLHVRGIVTVDQGGTGQSAQLNFAAFEGSAAGYINWSDTASGFKGYLGMPAFGRDLVYVTNTTNEEVFRIKGNPVAGTGWQFGIGTPNPLASFHVATNLLVSTAAVSPVLFISTAQGAVGIWTNAPEERFNVASTMLVGSKAAPLIYASTATNFTGIGTAAPRAMLEVGDGNLLAAGNYTGTVSSPAVSGPASLFMWVPSVAALRAGYAPGSDWNSIGLYSVALGNQTNAAGTAATVSGGYFNFATGDYSAVNGGRSNSTLAQSAVVGGGENNYISGKNAVIPGGEYNTVYSTDSFAGGNNGYLDVSAYGTFLWGNDDNSTGHGLGTANSFKITAPYTFLIDPADIKHYKVGIRTPSPQAALDVNGDAQFGAGVTKSTFTAEGFWMPRSMISGDLAALTPTALGEVVMNSTINDLCVSTGTVQAGQWALVGSRGIGNCY